jgi:hypothetical protein
MGGAAADLLATAGVDLVCLRAALLPCGASSRIVAQDLKTAWRQHYISNIVVILHDDSARAATYALVAP